MLKLLSVSLISVILISAMCVSAYAVADNNASLEIEFDRDEYIAGDVVYAYVSLNNIDDEANAGDFLQAYQAYVSYDSSKLEFVSGNWVYDAEEEGIVKTANPVSGKEVIATYFFSEDGINLEDEIHNGAIDLFEMEFKVKASVGSELEFGFDNAYSVEAITKDVEKVYNVTTVTDTANVVSGEASIVSNLTEYDGDTNTVSSILDVNVTRANGAVLIAKLYNKEIGQLVAPVLTKSLVKGLNRFGGKSGNELKFNVPDDISKRELEVQYFVWDSITGMKCISKTYTDGVY